jgi:hypothetical protein
MPGFVLCIHLVIQLHVVLLNWCVQQAGGTQLIHQQRAWSVVHVCCNTSVKKYDRICQDPIHLQCAVTSIDIVSVAVIAACRAALPQVTMFATPLVFPS